MQRDSLLVLLFVAIIVILVILFPTILAHVGWLGLVDLVWKGLVLWVLWEIRDRLPRRL